MKNTSSKNIIYKLAVDFDEEFNTKIPIKTLSNGNIVYNDFLIKIDKNQNWEVYYIPYKELLHKFFLKTCALMAVKSYLTLQFGEYQRIKHLDNRYQSHYTDITVYKHNIKKVTDDDDRAILLNKLEESNARAKEYRHQISSMFKAAFCINTL